MILRPAFIAALLLCFHPAIRAQPSYPGTMVTKLGSKQTGTITVNLGGPNGELIEITKTEKTKGKGSKSTVTTSTKLNTAIISYIIINDTTWYFRDIKYDYNEKYYRNVCVRLIAGNLDCGIFQTGRSAGNDNISIKLPGDDFSQLVSTEFDYYKVTSGWHMLKFGDCASLMGKMEKEENGYAWTDKTSRDERITMWKNWITEYNECKK